MITDIKAWLGEHPTKDMLEQNEDGSDYLPIWVVENLLNEMCEYLSEEEEVTNWDRHSHQYSFHEIGNFVWLSTSFELLVADRVLLCGSMIKLADYLDNSNWIFTGISEATKAGVKVLGNKFGKSLNARTVLKNKNGKPIAQKPVGQKLKPDAEIRKQHLKAIAEKDFKTTDKLESIYDLKIGE